VNASANAINPTQLDFRSQLFKNPSDRKSFVDKALPQIRPTLCNAGFRAIRLSQDSDSKDVYSYPLQCR